MSHTQEILRKIDNGMTVGMLEEALESMPKDAIVLFVCSYGDYHGTQQALHIEEAFDVSTNDLRPTSYSQNEVALAREDPAEIIDEPDAQPIVILR